MIRVLIVDDSAVVRETLSRHLEQFPDIEIVGCAVDPYHARDLIVEHKPDVITLDIAMPRMDGLSFLERLMKHHPLPVVVVSSLTPGNSETAIRALELGAVDVICKPDSAVSTMDIGRRLARAVRAAAGARPGRMIAPHAAAGAPAPPGPLHGRTTCEVIAIGASTGGTNALSVLLAGLPPTTPGTVVVQHMPELFTAAFAQRMNVLAAMDVREARDEDPVVTGVVLIAPGNKHLIVQRSGGRCVVRVKDGPAVHHQRPAVDVLFESVAESAGRNAIGVILTGMGADGAAGLLAMKDSGARTLAQDEKTSVVFGMPKEAIRLGAVESVVPLPLMAAAILRLLSDESEARAA